jgi:formate-dependent nitrite reductase membrane component NrfD
MFQGTLKDIITNVIAFIAGALSLVQAVIIIWQQWLETASPKPTLTEWIQLLILIITAVVAWYTGKDSNGKAKQA